MRHRRRRRALIRGALLGLTGLTATACAHNDVLVFGTSTTIGLNVETSSGQGAAPSIVLGYEREEAVWMPLAVNGWGARVPSCGWFTCTPVDGADNAESRLYQSLGRDSSGRLRVDTYSVFASLGAKFNSKANTGAEAGGGLAQFFATGGAAIAVAENRALVTALKVESEAGAEAQASAVAAASGFDGVVAGLSADERAANRQWADQQENIRTARLNRVVACARDPGTGAWRWPTIAGAMTLNPPTFRDRDRVGLAALTDEAGLRGALLTEMEWQIEAEAAAKRLTFC